LSDIPACGSFEGAPSGGARAKFTFPGKETMAREESLFIVHWFLRRAIFARHIDAAHETLRMKQAPLSFRIIPRQN
jgi:hypothetical protein